MNSDEKKKFMFIKIHYLNGWKRPLKSELNFGIMATRVQWAHVNVNRREKDQLNADRRKWIQSEWARRE